LKEQDEGSEKQKAIQKQELQKMMDTFKMCIWHGLGGPNIDNFGEKYVEE
jgi:hypothetical protein